MTLNVISNFAANVAQRNLVISDRAQTSALAKLSAGKRVLSAKDDAAALAIGSRLRAEVSALKTASQNASQATSLLQIADGALGTISNILVRMKALSVQSSSGQFSITERTVLNNEYQALSSEITRVSQSTSFNGTQLINGGAAVFAADGVAGSGVKTQEVKTGALAAAGISVTYNTTTLGAAKNDAFRLAFTKGASAGVGPENLTLTNTRTGAVQVIDITTAFSNAAVAGGGAKTDATLASGSTLAVDFANLGVKVTLDSNFNVTTNVAPAAIATTDTGGALTFGSPTDTAALPTSGIDNTTLTTLKAVGAFSSTTGVLTLNLSHTTTATNVTIDAKAGLRYALDGAAEGADNTATATIGDGNLHTVDVYTTTGNVKIATLTINNLTATTTADNTGTIAVDLGGLAFGTNFAAGATQQTFSFKVGSGSQSYDDLAFTVKAASASVLKLDTTDITTATNANTALTAVTTAIDTVNSQRANIGAAQNRLSFAADNLASSIQNNEAARSGLLDLNVAQEISVFSSAQVLVQTGIAMLAQANRVPQNLLRLFR